MLLPVLVPQRLTCFLGASKIQNELYSENKATGYRPTVNMDGSVIFNRYTAMS